VASIHVRLGDRKWISGKKEVVEWKKVFNSDSESDTENFQMENSKQHSIKLPSFKNSEGFGKPKNPNAGPS